MSILNKIRKWFQDETKSFEVPKEGDIIPNAPPEVLEGATNQFFGKKIDECVLCKQPIEEWSKRRHFGGALYHRRCFKNTMKLAKNQLNA